MFTAYMIGLAIQNVDATLEKKAEIFSNVFFLNFFKECQKILFCFSPYSTGRCSKR